MATKRRLKRNRTDTSPVIDLAARTARLTQLAACSMSAARASTTIAAGLPSPNPDVDSLIEALDVIEDSIDRYAEIVRWMAENCPRHPDDGIAETVRDNARKTAGWLVLMRQVSLLRCARDLRAAADQLDAALHLLRAPSDPAAMH